MGRLCEKLKIGMRNGLEQRCGGNFLAIFVGMGLGEKPTLQEGFSRGEGRSILAQTGYVFVKQKFRLGYTAHIPCCLS